jgi:hypothetical protein
MNIKSVFSTLIVTAALVSFASIASAMGGPGHGPTPTPSPVQNCSWPTWENCGDNNGDQVQMTCAAAKKYIRQNDGGYLTTEDGSTLGPIYASVNCSGSQRELYNVRTLDRMACTVGEFCRPYQR